MKKKKIIVSIIIVSTFSLVIGFVMVDAFVGRPNIVHDEERLRYFYSEDEAKKIEDRLNSYDDIEVKEFETNKELMKISDKLTPEEDKNSYLKDHLLSLQNLSMTEEVDRKIWVYDRESKKDRDYLDWLAKENKDIYIISERMLSSKEALASILSTNNKLKDYSINNIGGLTITTHNSVVEGVEGDVKVVDKDAISSKHKLKGWLNEK